MGREILSMVIDIGIPACAFMLMFIAGTEIRSHAVRNIGQSRRAVLIGSVGQLMTTPAIGLATIYMVAPDPSVAAGIVLLSVCPGGGISTYYTYVAGANVALSALITGLSTLVALMTIPVWLSLLSNYVQVGTELSRVPAGFVLGQLVLFMLLPIIAGAVLQHQRPQFIARHSAQLRRLSFAFVFAALMLTAFSIKSQLLLLARDIGFSSLVFILLAIVVAHLTCVGLRHGERHVVVIESGVRNIGIALLLGHAVLARNEFSVLASFLAGYIVLEMMILMGYAVFIRRTAQTSPTPSEHGQPELAEN